MSLARIAMVLAGILITLACATHTHFPDSSLTGRVYEIKIDDSLTPPPPLVIVQRGDEVRWTNMGNGPAEISVVQTRQELMSCQKGFVSTNVGYLFGTSEYENIVKATVSPHEYASLCFAIPGKYGYSVRRNPHTAGPENRMTGSITVE